MKSVFVKEVGKTSSAAWSTANDIESYTDNVDNYLVDTVLAVSGTGR